MSAVATLPIQPYLQLAQLRSERASGASTDDVDASATRHARLRARLLQMIIENEMSRRDDYRFLPR